MGWDLRGTSELVGWGVSVLGHQMKPRAGMVNTDKRLLGYDKTLTHPKIVRSPSKENLKFVVFTVVSTAVMPIQIGFRRGENFSVEDVDLESVESTLSLKRRGSCLRFLRVWFQRRLSKLKSIIVDTLRGPWFTSS